MIYNKGSPGQVNFWHGPSWYFAQLVAHATLCRFPSLSHMNLTALRNALLKTRKGLTFSLDSPETFRS